MVYIGLHTKYQYHTLSLSLTHTQLHNYQLLVLFNMKGLKTDCNSIKRYFNYLLL